MTQNPEDIHKGKLSLSIKNITGYLIKLEFQINKTEYLHNF